MELLIYLQFGEDALDSFAVDEIPQAGRQAYVDWVETEGISLKASIF